MDDANSKSSPEPTTASSREGLRGYRANVGGIRALDDEEADATFGPRVFLGKGHLRALCSKKTLRIDGEPPVLISLAQPWEYSEQTEVDYLGYLFVVKATIEVCPTIPEPEARYEITRIQKGTNNVGEQQTRYLWLQCKEAVGQILDEKWRTAACFKAGEQYHEELKNRAGDHDQQKQETEG